MYVDPVVLQVLVLRLKKPSSLPCVGDCILNSLRCIPEFMEVSRHFLKLMSHSQVSCQILIVQISALTAQPLTCVDESRPKTLNQRQDVQREALRATARLPTLTSLVRLADIQRDSDRYQERENAANRLDPSSLNFGLKRIPANLNTIHAVLPLY